jgi:hypothetical protein
MSDSNSPSESSPAPSISHSISGERKSSITSASQFAASKAVDTTPWPNTKNDYELKVCP